MEMWLFIHALTSTTVYLNIRGQGIEDGYIPDKSISNCALQWRHNEHNGAWNHQPHDCLLNRLFRRIPKKISKLCVTGFCEGNSPVTGEFPAQRASNTENVSIWWRHYGIALSCQITAGEWKYVDPCLDFPGIPDHRTTPTDVRT